MRTISIASLVGVVCLLTGCGDDGFYDLADEGDLGSAEGAFVGGNSMMPNGIYPNMLSPLALVPSDLAAGALTPAAMAPAALESITDPDEAGDVSRMFLRYAVGCALTSQQSFSFSWTDSKRALHAESYPGLIGLAPSWATAPLDAPGQRWVSACIAARTNYYGVSVNISARGFHDAIKQSGILEKLTFPKEEGVFWGNLFSSKPFVRSCHYAPNVDHSRALLRECAAGHVGAGGVESCGMIARVGSCDSMCDSLDPGNLFHARCAIDPAVSLANKTAEVITVFLQ
jgi:hypothetical protein